MIGMVLGTSEGKELLRLANEFTDDIFVTTATNYGGELLKEFSYKVLNTEPLDTEGFIQKIQEYSIEIMIDGTHPYAVEVSRNIMRACRMCGIKYIRYERASVGEVYRQEKLVSFIKSYDELPKVLELQGIKGVLFNTTGSRNISRIMSYAISNRMVHRVLPTMKVMKDMEEAGVRPDDLIMIKGPVSYGLNRSFYEDYKAEAVIMKDSGLAGGTKEKIEAALDMGIKVLIVEKEQIDYPNRYTDVEKCIQKAKEILNHES